MPTDPGSPASHELVDHTSEVTLRIRARDYRALITEATAAFVEFVPESLRGRADPQSREFALPAHDRVAALVQWLNDIVYLCEAEAWLPTEVEVDIEHDGDLRIRAKGEILRAPFVLVKAATLHQAFVRDREGGLEAEVTLDI